MRQADDSEHVVLSVVSSETAFRQLTENITLTRLQVFPAEDDDGNMSLYAHIHGLQ